jgi:hypothetical protein
MRTRTPVVSAVDSAGQRVLPAPAAGLVLGGCEHRGLVLSVCRSGPGQKRVSNGRIILGPTAVGPQAGGFGDRSGADRFGD